MNSFSPTGHNQWALPHNSNYWCSLWLTSSLCKSRVSRAPRAALTPGNTVLQAEGEGNTQPQPGDEAGSVQQLPLKDRREAGVSGQAFPSPSSVGILLGEAALSKYRHGSSAFDFSRNLIQKLLPYAAPLGITVPPQTAANTTAQEAKGEAPCSWGAACPNCHTSTHMVQAHTYNSCQPRKHKLYLRKTGST